MGTLAITVASFHAAILLCVQAIEAGDLTEARKQYQVAEAIHAGLPQTTSTAGASIARRQSLDGLRKALDPATDTSALNTGGRRFIRTRTSHG